jgi:hypothetical protein
LLFDVLSSFHALVPFSQYSVCNPGMLPLRKEVLIKRLAELAAVRDDRLCLWQRKETRVECFNACGVSLIEYIGLGHDQNVEHCKDFALSDGGPQCGVLALSSASAARLI